MVAGVAIGAVLEHAHPNSEGPEQGKLVGGVLEFFAGPAMLAIQRAVISGMHQTKLFYRAAPNDC